MDSQKNGIGLCQQKVNPFIEAADSKGDGHVDYREFVRILSTPAALGRRTGAVILDCDGTLLDTEKLRSEVTFLLLAPFMPGLECQDGTFTEWKERYIMKAAGRSFKQKEENINTERSAAGLADVASCWAQPRRDIAPAVCNQVTAARLKLNLPAEPMSDSLATAKKLEDDLVLSTCSEPCGKMRDVVEAFRRGCIPFCIASTSSRSSLLASLQAAGMDDLFEPNCDLVHSGESDFDPPRHKPKPEVYIKAAAALRAPLEECVAVEDSDSGVGSAANAGIGLIVGYVGGGQIPVRYRSEAAHKLLAGGRSEDGRGADIVIDDAMGLLGIVRAWRSAQLTLPIKSPAPGEAPLWGAGVQAWLPI
eukprot:TRINITY_DN13647_c0_g1_i2.p1 TRINITY_DN13647_c0_g1~~TRINITY_DN13647_c0_g1_i2.p1  ORF type:complete len:363 (+),score=62.24 TRINITY_DN13647_c0_g1_i2:894-1982(+)